MEAYRTAFVYVRERFAGTLKETDSGYSFMYDKDYLNSDAATAVSLTLPLTDEEYTLNTLFSFFDGLIPEGWLLDNVVKNWKLDYSDRFAELLVACKDPIGCVSIRADREVHPETEGVDVADYSQTKISDKESYSDIDKCLCCGKPLVDKKSECGWHISCIKNFFGTSKMPYFDISNESIDGYMFSTVNRGLTVPGVQKKLSLHLTRGKDARLTLVNYPTGYILKPQSDDYKALPEMEYLVMSMARISKIKTVPFALVKDSSGDFAYITKRIDRKREKREYSMLAMEDFCQLDRRLTNGKYRGSYERCGKVVKQYSTVAGIDNTELFLRVVFSFAVGNSDMHLKNFSLIERNAGQGDYVLSDAYDMMSTNVILPADKEQLALTLNGKKQNIRRKDFLAFADNLGIEERTAEKLIGRVVNLQDQYLEMCQQSYLPDDMKESLSNLICERIAILAGESRQTTGLI